MLRAGLLFLCALVLGSCAGSSTGDRVAASAGERSATDSLSKSASAPASAPEVRPADAAGVLAAVRAADAPVVLVNVWATWCGPCREEFPDLVRLQRDYRDRGLRVLFVSADFDDQVAEVKQFLAEHGVDAPSYIKTGDDMQFIDALDKRWTGALPATFLYDRTGRLRAFREGKASYAFFEREVQAILDSPNPRQEDPS